MTLRTPAPHRDPILSPKFSRVNQEAWSSPKQVLQAQFNIYCSSIREVQNLTFHKQ